METLKAHPALAYFVLAYALTWLPAGVVRRPGRRPLLRGARLPERRLSGLEPTAAAAHRDHRRRRRRRRAGQPNDAARAPRDAPRQTRPGSKYGCINPRAGVVACSSETTARRGSRGGSPARAATTRPHLAHPTGHPHARQRVLVGRGPDSTACRAKFRAYPAQDVDPLEADLGAPVGQADGRTAWRAWRALGGDPAGGTARRRGVRMARACRRTGRAG